MALHIQYNIPYNNGTNQSIYAYGNPDNINDSFPVLNEQDFMNKVAVFIPDSINNIFNKKQYWIRYLICIGDINTVINEIIKIAQNYYQNINVSHFINYKHIDFNENTLIHHAVQWCPNVELITALINNGGTLTHQNNDGYYPEENIHHTIWFNPFARILNMEFIFSYVDDNNIWFVRNKADFTNVINFIENLVGDDDSDSDSDGSDVHRL